MLAPVVVYADFESTIGDKNRQKSIMLCCLAVSYILTIDTQPRVFYAFLEEESDFRPFMEYLIRLTENVKKYLFDDLPLENTPEIERDYQSTFVYSFCHMNLENHKVRHHAHVACEYSNGVETRFYEAGQYICTCCTKCNLRLSFNKKNYRLPVYLHNGSHYDFTFIMILIATMPGNLEVIPTTETRKCRSNTMAFNSRTR